MEMMYIKYQNGIRVSKIKEGENILMSDSKILSFKNIKKTEEVKTTFTCNNEKSTNTSINNKIDEEITNFFFNAVHKNYISNKRRYYHTHTK